jgi:hypothetical protein
MTPANIRQVSPETIPSSAKASPSILSIIILSPNSRDLIDWGSAPSDICDTWKSVPSWPAYEVSAAGQIRRISCTKGAVAGRVLRQLPNRKTLYLSVCVSAHSIQKRIDVHRLVALAFLGPQPSARHLVAHNDGSRTNNIVTNLRWATQAENLRDCRAHGTARIGSRNPMALVTELDVRAMRRMKAFGIPRKVIAEGYGIHPRSAFRILAGTSWEHVQ